MKGWEDVNAIKTMIAKGHNVSEVARKLKIDRKTVRKYRDMKMELIADQLQRSKTRRRQLTSYEDWITKKVDQMKEDGLLNSQVVCEELRKLGYRGSARTVRRFVAKYRQKTGRRRIYKRFETEPGQQAQVDLGELRLKRGGNRLTVYCVAMVLGSSRHKYAEWYERPVDTEMFLEFHERAFAYFGGVPQEVVYDQTKLVILKERYGEVEFNEAFYGYATWLGMKPHICHTRDPESKGKIEAVVKYLKRNFMAGRQFDHLGDLNHQCLRWLDEVGNAKVHETTGRIPKEAWGEERLLLKPKPQGSYRFKPATRAQSVYLDGLVKVLGNRYSVPQSHHGVEVKVRVTDEQIEIYCLENTLLATHWRYTGKGRRFIKEEHYERTYKVPTKQLGVEVAKIYDHPELPAVLKRSFPRHFREQCKQLIALAPHYSPEMLHEATARTLRYRCTSYLNIKKALAYLESTGAFPSPTMGEPPIQLALDFAIDQRPLDYYDHQVGVAP